MNRTISFLLLSFALVRAAEPQPYDGYAQDRALLRDTYLLTNPNHPPINASSGKACDAARRLFSRLTFVGLTRKRVLAILGDPRTISDYGIAAAAAPDSPLEYRFDTGFGGWDYVIEFRGGLVASVKENGFN